MSSILTGISAADIVTAVTAAGAILAAAGFAIWGTRKVGGFFGK